MDKRKNIEQRTVHPRFLGIPAIKGDSLNRRDNAALSEIRRIVEEERDISRRLTNLRAQEALKIETYHKIVKILGGRSEQ